MNTNHPLANLRDIHLPDPISAWPLAPGWTILALLITVLLASTVYFAYRHWRKMRAKRYALKELQALQENYHNAKNTLEAGSKLSSLLKQLALHYYAEHQIAGLHGKAWLDFLAKTGILP